MLPTRQLLIISNELIVQKFTGNVLRKNIAMSTALVLGTGYWVLPLSPPRVVHRFADRYCHRQW